MGLLADLDANRPRVGPLAVIELLLAELSDELAGELRTALTARAAPETRHHGRQKWLYSATRIARQLSGYPEVVEVLEAAGFEGRVHESTVQRWREINVEA